MKQKISDLSARREALLAELKQVEEALSQAQQEESQLPETIKLLEQERNIQAHKALLMKKKLKPVEGSADDPGAVEHVNPSSATYPALFFPTLLVLWSSR